MATRNDLADNAKKTSIGLLNANLADAADLYNATRQAHWNVKGPHFAGLHKLFEEFYDQLAEGVDDLAERIVQLGGQAVGTSQAVAGATRLPPYDTAMTAGLDHVRALAERYALVAKQLRGDIDRADEAGDADTADLFTAQSRAIDKMLWMLEAHLQGDR